jgi:hypothetical protein
MRGFRTLSMQVAAPPAGQGAVFAPSATQRVKLRSLQYTLTTDAVVGNRFLWAQLLDLNNMPVFSTGWTTNIAASSTLGVVLSPAYSQPSGILLGGQGAAGLPFPDEWMPPGWSIKLGIAFVDAGDQLSIINYAADFSEDVWHHDQELAAHLAFLQALAG